MPAGGPPLSPELRRSGIRYTISVSLIILAVVITLSVEKVSIWVSVLVANVIALGCLAVVGRNLKKHPRSQLK
jgi:hypothetical protein